MTLQMHSIETLLARTVSRITADATRFDVAPAETAVFLLDDDDVFWASARIADPPCGTLYLVAPRPLLTRDDTMPPEARLSNWVRDMARLYARTLLAGAVPKLSHCVTGTGHPHTPDPIVELSFLADGRFPLRCTLDLSMPAAHAAPPPHESGKSLA